MYAAATENILDEDLVVISVEQHMDDIPDVTQTQVLLWWFAWLPGWMHTGQAISLWVPDTALCLPALPSLTGCLPLLGQKCP
jgi:hypothetical protein